MDKSSGTVLWLTIAAAVGSDGSANNHVRFVHATTEEEAIGLAYQQFRKEHPRLPAPTCNASLVGNRQDLLTGLLGIDMSKAAKEEIEGEVGKMYVSWKRNKDTIAAVVVFRPENIDVFEQKILYKDASDSTYDVAKKFLTEVFKTIFWYSKERGTEIRGD